jgi:hypothetical protein
MTMQIYRFIVRTTANLSFRRASCAPCHRQYSFPQRFPRPRVMQKFVDVRLRCCVPRDTPIPVKTVTSWAERS